MKRWLPAPLVSATLLVVWLLLESSLDPGTLILGAVIALGAPLLAAPLRPLPVRVRRPGVILRLMVAVVADAVRSNFGVAHGVLVHPKSVRVATFVTIPLELRDANALATLALITTFVPGTVWCELALDRSLLRLHVFDVVDEAAFVEHYKSRYERPLMEIYET